MKRRIDLGDTPYTVTLIKDENGNRQMTVDNGPRLPVGLTAVTPGTFQVRVGDTSARVDLAVKGNRAYVRAFGRHVALSIVNPVEQAAQESGGGTNRVRAPMPGTVVEVSVSPGDSVVKGQALVTIESMKILTVLTAPRDAAVDRVHVDAGQAFDKNAVLITLSESIKDN